MPVRCSRRQALRVVALLLLALPAHAEEPPPAPAGAKEGQAVVLDDATWVVHRGRLYRMGDPALDDEASVISVTASRAGAATDTVRTEVITANDLAENGARTLADVLEEQAGIQVNSALGLGQEVQLDGLDGRHVLILINGRPVTGRVNNRVDVGRLPVSPGSVEKIEVVRGPMSALHGSEALGGVVNIITKRPTLDAGGEVELGTQLVSGGLWRTLGLHGRGGAGPVAARIDVNASDLPGLDRNSDGRGDMPDRRQLGLHAEAALAVLDTVSFRGQVDGALAHAVNRTSARAPFADRARNEEWSAAALLEADIFDDATLAFDLRVARFRHRFDKLPSGAALAPPSFCGDSGLPFDPACPAPPDLRTDAIQDESRLEVRFNDTLLRGASWAHELTTALGAVVTRQHARRMNGDGDDTIPGGGDRLLVATFGEVMWQPLPWLTLVPGARLDGAVLDGASTNASDSHRVAFGPRIAARIDGPMGLGLRASYGRGFRLPSFEERFLRFDHAELGYIIEGNAGLAPERSHGMRAEALWSLRDGVALSLEGALNLLEDLIVEDPVDTRDGIAVYTYRNAAYAQTSTLTARLRLEPLDGVRAAVAWRYLVAAVDTSACPASNPWFCNDPQVRSLPLRAAHSVDANLRWELAPTKTTLFVRVDALSERPVDIDDDGEILAAPPFAVVSAGVRQPVFEHAELVVGLENLLDRYDPIYGPKPGRHATVHLRVWN